MTDITILRKMTKQQLIVVVLKALNWAYKSEVIDTAMQDVIIGDGKEYANKGDWMESQLDEWL